MKDIASWALNVATLRGASYADVRIADDRSRALGTKNGKVSSASDSESLGFGVRVIADGAWGFAASDDVSRAAVEETAARAVSIAKASSRVKERDIRMAPEKAVTAEWTSPFQVDPLRFPWNRILICFCRLMRRCGPCPASPWRKRI